MQKTINVDFKKINEQISHDIESANQHTLDQNPNADLDKINQIAKIASAVCISALKAYHEELCKALLDTSEHH